MEVIHIFKDGTVTTELKDVYVPKEIVERVYRIMRADDDEDRKQEVQVKKR